MAWQHMGWMEHLIVYLNRKAVHRAIKSGEQVHCPVTPVLVLCTQRRALEARRSIGINFAWKTMLRVSLAQECVAQCPHQITLHMVGIDHPQRRATL